MASITITIPDPVISRVLDAIAAQHGYNAATDGTKAAFAKKMVIQWVKTQIKTQEGDLASKAAFATTHASIDTDIVIT